MTTIKDIRTRIWKNRYFTNIQRKSSWNLLGRYTCYKHIRNSLFLSLSFSLKMLITFSPSLHLPLHHLLQILSLPFFSHYRQHIIWSDAENAKIQSPVIWIKYNMQGNLTAYLHYNLYCMSSFNSRLNLWNSA